MTPAVRRSVMLMRRRARLMRPLVAAARAMTAARLAVHDLYYACCMTLGYARTASYTVAVGNSSVFLH